MSAWTELKQSLIQTRGSRCELCGEPKLDSELDAHHWAFRRMKGHPELDVFQNVVLLCRPCHSSGLGYRAKQIFWDQMIARGVDMQGWIESLPRKVKHL